MKDLGRPLTKMKRGEAHLLDGACGAPGTYLIAEFSFFFLFLQPFPGRGCGWLQPPFGEATTIGVEVEWRPPLRMLTLRPPCPCHPENTPNSRD